MSARRIAIAVTVAACFTILFVWLAGPSPLARITHAEGSLDRDRRGAENQWLSAKLGDELAIGDAVRTGKQSRARLTLSGGTVLDVAPTTIVRLLSDLPGRESFRIESGAVEVQADAELSFGTPAGLVRVSKGSRLSVRQSGGNTWVRVDLGRAQLGWGESERALAAGQEARSDAPSAAGARDTASALVSHTASAPAPDARQAGVQARVRGGEVRVQRAGEKALTGIAEGQHLLPVGTRVSVAESSSLELEQAQGGRLITSGKAELVVGDGVGVATRVLDGKLRAAAGKVPVEIEVPGGRLVLLVDEKGPAVGSVRIEKSDTRVDVEAGTMLLQGAGEDQRLGAGSQGRLSTRGSAQVEYHAPERSDMGLAAGISTTVHDPAPPTAIALSFAGACGDAQGVLEQQSARGYQERGRAREAVLSWFPLGVSGYRVRCEQAEGGLGKVVASGKVTVLHDAAVRRVTKRAPEIEVDLDGRKYTAVYQTLLPRVRVRLPDVPGAGSLPLRVEGSGQARRFNPKAGGWLLDSGVLGEGTHTLRLDAQGAAARIKPTTLLIRYDNAAPAAYLEGVTQVSLESDGSVVLRGGAVEESQISLEGKPVALDRASRFEARAVPGVGTRGVGLWIRHPRLGSHHYVRRIQGRSEAP